MFKGKISNSLHTWGRLYVVTLFFVTLAAFLFWLDFFRISEAEIDILVVGKTPATSTDQVIENFIALSQNLSFYDRIIAANDRIDDPFLGYPKDERKKLWNEMFTAKRSGESGMLVLSIKNDRAEIAKLLAEQTAKEIFSQAGFYYNVKNDIDMRVVDGPIVRSTIAGGVRYVLVSIGTGILFTSLFFWLLQIVPFFFRKKKEDGSNRQTDLESADREKAYPHFNIGDSVPLIDPKKFLPSRPASLSYENYSLEEKQEEKRIREEILSSRSSSKASAPANLPIAPDENDLPIAMEDLPFQFEDTEEEKEPEEFEQALLHSRASEQKAPEPTVEEYKRRLNELLQGDKQ